MGADRKRLIAAERAPFNTLIKLIEQELELVSEGRLAELHEAIARTGAHLSTLAQPVPESAEPLVLRAEAMRGRVMIETERLRQGLAQSRASLRRSRRVTRKYAPPRARRYSTTA